MTKATRNHKLLFIFSTQFYCYPLLIGWTFMPQINRYIKHSATHTTHKLSLSFIPLLEVNATQNTFFTAQGVVILHEIIKQTSPSIFSIT